MHVCTAFIRRGEKNDNKKRKMRGWGVHTYMHAHTHMAAASRQLNDFFRKAKEKIVPAPNELL